MVFWGSGRRQGSRPGAVEGGRAAGPGQVEGGRVAGPGQVDKLIFLHISPTCPDFPVSVEAPGDLFSLFSWRPFRQPSTAHLLSSLGLLFSGFCARPSPWGLRSGPTALRLCSACLGYCVGCRTGPPALVLFGSNPPPYTSAKFFFLELSPDGSPPCLVAFRGSQVSTKLGENFLTEHAGTPTCRST